MTQLPNIQVHRINWRGIDIELVYVPKRWDVIASLEIRSIDPPNEPLPITDTGYRSHFHPIGSIEASGEKVVTMVTKWLDAETVTERWKAVEANNRQGTLF